MTLSRMMTRLQSVFRLIVVILLALSAHGLFADGAHAQERRWIQVEALPGAARANDRAAAFQSDFANVWGFGLPSGWYGIVLGPYDAADVAEVLSGLKAGGRIPADSYVTDGREFRDQFWPLDDNGEATILPEPLNTPDAPAAGPAPEPVAAQEPVAPPEPVEETLAEARASEAALDEGGRKGLQTALQWFGFYQGGIDGAFGPGTRNSMAAWQSASGHEATGILTTRQRADLIAAHQAEILAFGFATVEEQESGIDVILPLSLVEFDRYEPPFVHFREKNGSGLSIVLISQPGDTGSLRGLYDIIETFEAMPEGGIRERGESEFRLAATSATRDSRAWARLSGGLIKGWMAFARPENAARDARVFEVIATSFRAVGDTALDPGLVPLDEAARRGLVAGIEVKKPIRGRSGFYVSKEGAVLTTSDAVRACGRVTIDHATEAKLVFEDADSGLALLAPASALAPPVVARFASVARPGAAIVVAGYPYEGRLSAPVLTHGTFEEAQGLDGTTGLARLSVAVQPGDVGGAVIDASGAVIGMLLPRAQGGAQDLPGDVAFAADAARIAGMLSAQGISLATAPEGAAALAPELLTREARGMTVLVSCWQ